MNTTATDRRLRWIDSARGIGILLVVLGHAFRPAMLEVAWCDFLFQLIYSIHMPLFFVLSGYTFALTYPNYLSSPKTFILKRTKALLIPLLTWAVIVYLCFFAAYRIPPLAAMLSASSYEMISPLNYLYLTLLWENPYAAHLWFIWVLWIINLLAFFCAYILQKCRHWQTLLALLSLPCLAIALLCPLPTALRKVFAYLFFFAAGILLANRGTARLTADGKTIVFSITGSGILLLVSMLNAWGDYTPRGVGLVLQNLLLALAVLPTIRGLLLLCQKLEGLAFLQRLGRDSFSVYLLHQPFCGGFAGILLYNKLGLPIPAVLAICSLLSIALPLTVQWLARRVRWIGALTKPLLHIG